MGKDRSGRGPKWARTEVGIVRTEVGATFRIRTEVGIPRFMYVRAAMLLIKCPRQNDLSRFRCALTALHLF